MSCDRRIDQSATSIQSLLNTNGATFLMTSHVRSALWTLLKLGKIFDEVAKLGKSTQDTYNRGGWLIL